MPSFATTLIAHQRVRTAKIVRLAPQRRLNSGIVRTFNHDLAHLESADPMFTCTDPCEKVRPEHEHKYSGHGRDDRCGGGEHAKAV